MSVGPGDPQASFLIVGTLTKSLQANLHFSSRNGAQRRDDRRFRPCRKRFCLALCECSGRSFALFAVRLQPDRPVLFSACRARVWRGPFSRSIPAKLRAHGTAGEENPPPNADRHQNSEQYLVNRANNVIGPGDSRLVKKQEKRAPGNGKGCKPKGRSSCPLPEPQKSNRRDDPNHAEQQCRSVHNRHHWRVPKFTDPGSAPKREPGHAENRQRTDQLEHRHSNDRGGRSLRSNPLCGWRSVHFVRIGSRKCHNLTLSHNGIPSLSSGVALKC